MDENDNDVKKPTLPQGYEYISDYTSKAQRELRDIDAKIEALPKDRQDTDAPKPYGTVRQSEASKYNSEKIRFEQQKEEVKTKLVQDIGRETKNADPKDVAAIQDFSENAVKDGVYNKQAKNTEAFEKKQDDFSKLRDDAETKREAGQKTKNNFSSRSDRLFSNTNYNVQANQVNLNQVNVSKDNITFNMMTEAGQPQEVSRSAIALSKSNFAKEQNALDKETTNNKDKQPDVDKADFSVNKSDITEPSNPGSSGASKTTPSKDER